MFILYSVLPAARFDQRYKLGPVTFDNISGLEDELEGQKT